MVLPALGALGAGIGLLSALGGPSQEDEMLRKMLEDQATGRGQSPAQMAMRQAGQQAAVSGAQVANATPGVAPGVRVRSALDATGRAQGQIAGQAGILQAREQQMAQHQLQQQNMADRQQRNMVLGGGLKALSGAIPVLMGPDQAAQGATQQAPQGQPAQQASPQTAQPQQVPPSPVGQVGGVADVLGGFVTQGPMALLGGAQQQPQGFPGVRNRVAGAMQPEDGTEMDFLSNLLQLQGGLGSLLGF